jgi:hypothetical protein
MVNLEAMFLDVVFTPCDNLMRLLMKSWHVLLNKTPSKRGKEKQRERTQVRTKSTTTQSESERGIGTNHVPKPPPIARSISEKGRELERVASLEKSSPYSIGVLCW